MEEIQYTGTVKETPITNWASWAWVRYACVAARISVCEREGSNKFFFFRERERAFFDERQARWQITLRVDFIPRAANV